MAKMYLDQPLEAAEAIEQAIRVSPNDLWLATWLGTLSATYYMARNYEKAVAIARLAVQRAPHYPIGQRSLTNALAQMGHLDEARDTLNRFLALSPAYSTETARRSAPFRDDDVFEHYLAGLRIAGWDN